MLDAVWADPVFPDIDLGYFEPTSDVKNSPWHRERSSLMDAIIKFANKMYDQQNGPDAVFTDCEPGDLIGFARTYVSETDENGDSVNYELWSPIRPYELGEGKGTPRTFSVSNLAVDPTTNNVVFHWLHDKSLEGKSTKMFGGNDSYNKMTLDGIANHEMVNGQKLDQFYHFSTTDSRFTEASLRNAMLRTMFMESRHRPFGYNAADKPDFLPNQGDQKIKQALLTGMTTDKHGNQVPVNLGHWKEWMKKRVTFFSTNPKKVQDITQRKWNERMNAFVTDQVLKCIHCGVNPSIFLSTYVYNEEGERLDTDAAFHWNILFDEGGTTYQDNILTFFNYLMPNFCPQDSSHTFSWDTVESGMSENMDTFFVVDPKTKTLMNLVQYFDPDGNEYWLPQHVISDYWFGDEHYSGFCRAYVAPSHKSVSTMLASALWNTEGTGTDIKHLIESVSSEYATPDSLCKTYIIDPDQA